VVITWALRNRLLTTTLQKWSDVGQSPEASQTTTIIVKNAGGTVVRTVSGVAGSTYTYTTEFELADTGSAMPEIIFEIKSFVGATASFQTFVYKVKKTLPGLPSNMDLSLTVAASPVSGAVTLNIDEEA
jgi:hypothetical protein